MKYLLLSLILSILHVNLGKRLNVDLTLNKDDLCAHPFPSEDLFGVTFANKTANLVKVNVILNDTELVNMIKDPKIITHDIIWDDVELAIRKERERIDATPKWDRSMLPDLFFLDYRDWIQYEEFIAALLLRHSDITSMGFLSPTTLQGRNIPVITLFGEGGSTGKPGFYIQSEIHAREWLANMAVMYIMNAFAEAYDDPDNENHGRVKNILDNINIYIVPTLNIDGYIYSWTSNRMWRKNRRNNGGGSFGVDLNRNYDGPTNPSTWCTTGASTNPNSDSYCGTAPFSEPETQASRNFVIDPDNNVVAAWDMHTSGQLILLPWAYSSSASLTPPYNTLYPQLGEEMQQAMLDAGGVNYDPIRTSSFCTCSGSSIDFFHSSSLEGTPQTIGMGWEGRGPGFNPNPSNIIPAGEEQFIATMTLADTLF